MIAPKEESRDLVMQWLEEAGLKDHASISPRGDAIIVKTSISEVEKLLNAEYNAFSKYITNPVHKMASICDTLLKTHLLTGAQLDLILEPRLSGLLSTVFQMRSLLTLIWSNPPHSSV